MNIGYIAPVVYPFVKGGAEKRIHEIGSRLADRGHDVTIYSRHWWDGPERMEHAGMTLQSVGPASDIYVEGDRRSTTSALGFAARVLPAVARTDHDLVVTPVAPYFHVSTAKLGSMLKDTRLVVTWHEVWGDYWIDYMGRSGHIGNVIEHAIGRVPCHAVAPSEMTANRLAAIGPSREDIDVIPNGIDIESIRTVEEAAGGFDVLYAGRLIKDKNVDMLLEAFDDVGEDATLGIIGDGPLRPELEAQAAELDSAGRITFLGFLESYDDVLAHMRAASTFISPSFREGFGITLLEAMASDCTVITVDHPHSAASEVVDEAGFVTDPNVAAVGQALERALDGDRPTRDPVEAASTYDWDVITDQTEELYFEIAASGDEVRQPPLIN